MGAPEVTRTKGTPMAKRSDKAVKNDGPIWWLVDHGGAPRWLIIIGSVVAVAGVLAFIFEPTGWMPL